MVKFLISNYVKRQISLENIKEEEASVYQYGYTLLFEKMMNFGISLLVTIFTNGWFAAGVFMLAFAPIRQYSGGWHAKTFASCTFISNMILLLNIFIYKSKIDIPVSGLISVDVIVSCIIIGFSPVQSSKNLNAKECLRYKKIVCILIIVSMMFELVLVCLNHIEVISIFVYAHSIIAIALLLGKIKNTM